MDIAFAFLLLCCAASDRRYRRIPNTLISAMLGLSVVHLIGACCYGYSLMPYFMAVPLFCLCYMCWRRGLIGGGDVKLMTAICFYMGFWLTAAAFEVSLLVMMIQYMLYRHSHKRRRYMRIALAPPLAFGCIAAMIGQYILLIF